MRVRSGFVSTLAVGMLVFACGKSESPPSRPPAPPPPSPQAAAPATQPAPFRVVGVDLGKAVGADKKIAQPTTSFAPSDTIFAVVTSDGSAPSVALKARWTYQDGQLVDETARTIAPTGPPRPSSTSPSRAAGRPASTRSRSRRTARRSA